VVTKVKIIRGGKGFVQFSEEAGRDKAVELNG